MDNHFYFTVSIMFIGGVLMMPMLMLMAWMWKHFLDRDRRDNRKRRREELLAELRGDAP